ncbi:protein NONRESPONDING TO OXYLIPINS 2, mitochondrial-like isoform X2 [Actinidia eriantha]|uniref:protein NONRESPONDING TO OXYLIPINS 2, mitochondrial-like isoform X2 n=1 Tax=Actinidia eriantha TaxID=165200 RepID=UPI002583F56B|nr:protein NONRESPONDING TO OXYLIPINS 2, mitochondrial-like isoform X2 [Actinidia eriantha]
MASRYRSISRPTLNLLKSTITTSTPKSIPSLRSTLSSPSFRRSVPQLGSLQSMLPLHTAVSSARLASYLGVDSKELGLSVPR